MDEEKDNVEDPFIEVLKILDYEYIPPKELRRKTSEVVLEPQFKQALSKINPWISQPNVNKVYKEIVDLGSGYMFENNQKFYQILNEGIKVQQRFGARDEYRTVYIIDLENYTKNLFHVTQQFTVKISKNHIIPDVVAFVNGLPLVVVECKSPTLANPKTSGIKQLIRYQRQSPKLFSYAQILIATHASTAFYGTTNTLPQDYSVWRDPFPYKIKQIIEVGNKLGKSFDLYKKKDLLNRQEVLIHGMLSKQNILPIISNNIVFEKDGTTGKSIKKIARYQQFKGVSKVYNNIIAKMDDKDSEERRKGGVVWHTQGSGKSLTMVFLAFTLKRDPRLKNPTVLIVNDRIALDNQIYETFVNCGYPAPTHVRTIAQLHQELRISTGKTLITTIQRFQHEDPEKRKKKEKFNKISDNDNIFVLVDEAHRTQDGDLASNMRAALPNAIFVAFTGTPISKVDRNTRRNFGEYADVYDIKQAVDDGATVPIHYELRKIKTLLEKETLLEAINEEFDEYSDESKNRISKLVNYRHLLEAEERIKTIVPDLVKHYQDIIEPNGMKGQIVSATRMGALRYHLEILKMRRMQEDGELEGYGSIPRSELVYSPSAKDSLAINSYNDANVLIKAIQDLMLPIDVEGMLVKKIEQRKADYKYEPYEAQEDIRLMESLLYLFSRSKQGEENVIKEFKKDFPRDDNGEFLDSRDEVKLIIVQNKLLTGFDAPVEQVMYLDNVIKEHNLLQAIARVNRRYGEIKEYGLIVDYCGVLTLLEQALAIFEDKDIKDPVINYEEVIDIIREFIEKCKAPIISEYPKVEESVVLLERDRDVWAEFKVNYRKIVKGMDLLLPRIEAQEFISTVESLSIIYKFGILAIDGEKDSIEEWSRKVRKVVDEHIKVLPDREKLEEINIFDEDFIKLAVTKFKQKALVANYTNKTVSKLIIDLSENDPAFAEKLMEKLDKIVETFNETGDLDNFLNEIEEIRTQAIKHGEIGDELGLNEHEFALYNFMLKATTTEDVAKQLSQQLFAVIKDAVKFEWSTKASVIKDVRNIILDFLEESDLLSDEIDRDKFGEEILEFAKNNIELE